MWTRSSRVCSSAACFWRTVASGGLQLGLGHLEGGLSRGHLGRGRTHLRLARGQLRLRRPEGGLAGPLLGPRRLELSLGGVERRLGLVPLALRDELPPGEVHPAVQLDARVAGGRAVPGDVGLGRGDHRPRVLDVGPHALHVGLGGHGSGPGVLHVRPHLLHVGPLVQHLGLGALDIRGRRVDLRLEDIGIDPGDQLVATDGGVEIHQDLADLAGHLAADLHGRDGRQGAGRRYRGDDRAAIHRRRPEARHRGAAGREDIPRRGEGRQDPQGDQQTYATPPHAPHCRTQPHSHDTFDASGQGGVRRPEIPSTDGRRPGRGWRARPGSP